MEVIQRLTMQEDVITNMEVDGEDSLTLANFSLNLQTLATTTVVADNVGVSRRGRKPRGLPTDSIKANVATVKRAEGVQSNLDPQFPSFVKHMLRSHVTLGFWLGLPSGFCKSYLPDHDVGITLVGENKEEYLTNFLVKKGGLSGGWRGFSIAHKIVEGDVVVFQLVTPYKFKVYITRANDLTDVNGALSLVNLQAPPIQSDSDNGITENPSRENPNALQLALKGNSQSRSPPTEEPGNDSEEVSSGVLDGIRPLETLIEFKNVKTVENFTIAVNGLVIDSEISDYVRAKYYGLCCSQKAFLHDHIIEGINCKLVAGIICETVNIADAIRASKLSTSQNDFKIWDKSLKAFEQLGLNVGFLRARIKQLVNFSKSQQTKKSKRYEEAILGRSRVKNEIKSTEEKLLELHETLSRFDNEIETLEMEMGNHGMKFHAKASAPWC